MIIMNTLGWSLIGKGPYANRTEWDNETFSIYVTDLGSIWSEHQTILDIAVRCQVRFLPVSNYNRFLIESTVFF